MINAGAKIERIREEAIAPEVDRIVEAIDKGSIKSSQTGYISDADLNNAPLDTEFTWTSNYRRYIDYSISPIKPEKSLLYFNDYMLQDLNDRVRGRLISPTTLRIYNNTASGSNYRIRELTWRVLELY